MNKKIAALFFGALLCFQLVSCSKNSVMSDSSYDNGYFDTKFYEYGNDMDKAEESERFMNSETGNFGDITSNTSGDSSLNDLSDRKIIKTASISFETETYDEFTVSLAQCISAYGGYIESSYSYGGDSYNSYSRRNSEYTVRVPEKNYDSFMNSASGIGNVTSKSENAEDVTMSYVDTESRLKSLRTEYDALIDILEKAESLDDVITLQARISEVTYEIESYQSQLRKYDDLISYCTVRISVSEVKKVVPPQETMNFGEKVKNGLSETFEDIAEGFTDFSVWFIVSLPYIVIWAVVIVLIVIIIKVIIKSTKKRKQRKNAERIAKIINDEKNKTDKNN